LKIINSILYYNVLLCVAALLLTISAQIQLGFSPLFRPYFILIFFATLFEYNRTRLIAFLKRSKIQYPYLLIFFCSVSGILIIGWLIKPEVLLTFLLLGIITTLYYLPFNRKRNQLFNLRQIPYLKTFLIAFVWSGVTIFLPSIDSGISLFDSKVILLFSERFLFIMAVAIPFDIRDMNKDRISNLKTIPILISPGNAIILTYVSLIISFIVSVYHYQEINNWFITFALFVSLIITIVILRSKFLKTTGQHYYHLLDGTLLLQGSLVLVFFFLSRY
jgi:4-hydroxybenzoate polyprenyltransferase